MWLNGDPEAPGGDAPSGYTPSAGGDQQAG